MSDRPLEAGIQRDFRERMSYSDYLRLDLLLAAQQPVSDPPRHDELLFIIQHQTSALWLKLMLHELLAARRLLAADDPAPALKNLARVKHIMHTLIEQWNVLATLTPSEYAEFRNYLQSASGFQSWQYRAIEFILGNKDNAMLQVHDHDVAVYELLVELRDSPSLYLHTHEHWSEYEACETLVDVEDRFQTWRFRHLKTVERIIGSKPGTGGSSGVPFLRKALELTFFPELYAVRAVIGE